MHLLGIIKGDLTFIEWSVALDTAPGDSERWQALLRSWIPEWTHSLARALAHRAT